MTNVRAALLNEAHTPLILDQVALNDPAPDEVRVRITASGICHSDLRPIHGETVSIRLPMILGHEATGVIDEAGSAVHGLKRGDRVIASFLPTCGHCWFCNRGETELCTLSLKVLNAPPSRGRDSAGRDVYPMSGLGSFAEAMVVPERSVVKVETDLPDEQLALLGCAVTTGVCSVFNTARVTPGSSVAVLGAGGVGQSVVQGARMAGAAQIIVVEPVGAKRDQAVNLGATHAVDPLEEDAVQFVRELTSRRGVDYAFEAAGRADSADQGYDMLRRGGTLVYVGAQPIDATPNWSSYMHMMNEKRVVGSLYGSARTARDFPLLVGLVESGALDVGAMVSRRVSLRDINEAIEATEKGEVTRAVIVS